MDLTKDKAKMGRPGLGQSVFVGLKLPMSLDTRFKNTAEQLTLRGYKTNKSELIRTLAEYWLPFALEVYEERDNK